MFGATGSGKTSGVAKHLAYGYLAAGFGGLVLCAKKEERHQWQKWADDTGRSDDLVVVDTSGRWRFNFLEHEASRPEEGGQGDNKFWSDALHFLNTNLVELPILAGRRMLYAKNWATSCLRTTTFSAFV